MNERIKELSKEAWRQIDVSKIRGRHVAYTKIFAELIVKECVGIVDKIVPPGYADYPDYRDQIEQSFRRECAMEIKKHFGVEQ